MSGTDLPTRVLARIFFVIWVVAIVMLAGSAVVYNLGGVAGMNPDSRPQLSEVLVQVFLVLIPLGVFVFALVMIGKRQWSLGIIGIVLTLIWIGAKLLG